MSEKMTDRIAALLDKATAKGTTPEEAEAYQTKAEELMLKYAIDQAQVAAKRDAAGEAAEKIISTKFWVDGSYAAALQEMCWNAGEALGVVKVYYQISRGAKNREGWVILTGFESDVKQHEAMLLSLVEQSKVALRFWIRENPWLRDMPSSGWTSKKSFIKGFGEGVRSRLVQRVKQEEPGTGLILADRGSRVQRHLDDTIGKIREVPAQRGDMFASLDGHAAGVQARLGDGAIDHRKEVSA